MQTPKRLAVLIDAENVNASCASDLMSMISKLGNPIIKRAYGDWTTTQLMPWKKVLFDLAIKPCQQFRYKKGKNSSDGALMMDAIELLLGGGLQGICIVSADSDFIGLAGRIKERGLVVYGFGGADTSRAFRVACDEFYCIAMAVSGKSGDVVLVAETS